MHWVVEVTDVDDPHSYADDGDDLGQLLAKLIQLLLQGCLILLSGSHLVSDLAYLSIYTSGNNHTHGLSRCNVSALKQQVCTCWLKHN